MQIFSIFSILIWLPVASAFKLQRITNIGDHGSFCTTDRDDVYSPKNCMKIGCKPVDTNRSKRLRLQDMRAVEALSDAFVGGTVGVMSVAFILELKKVADQRLDGCPYCMGNGEILCGQCFGNPLGVPESSAPGAAMITCNVCNGRGLVQCINCKGDGRITPIILQSKAIRDPDYANPSLQERNKK